MGGKIFFAGCGRADYNGATEAVWRTPKYPRPPNFSGPGRGGDQAALEQLTPRVYRELRRIAGHFMQNERPGRTIQTTALVHEAYLQLIDVANVDWQHRAHFFAVSARIMRHILLNAARSRATAKRGGNLGRVNLDEIPDVSSRRGSELIALDDALNLLAQVDPRKAQVIELRFFGGLSVQETAVALRISEASVLRDWRLAKAWLSAEMSGNRDPEK